MSIKLQSIKKGIETGSPLIFSAAFFGIIFGFTGGSGGLPLLFVSAMSIIIFAGSAQFITLLLIIENEILLAIVITGILINLRHLLYGAVISKIITFKGLKKLLIAYLLTDEAFLVTTLVEKEQKHARIKNYQLDYVLIGAGFTLWLSWNIMTIIGFYIFSLSAGLISLPENFVISASFVGFLVQQWIVNPGDRSLMIFASLIALILGFFVSNSLILITVMISGASFAMWKKFKIRRVQNTEL